MKLDRLLAITVLLLNRGRVSAKELSERFEVTSKTIYRDMDTLNQAGIPIIAYQGVSGGFEIMESFMIDRHWLSVEEMRSLVTAVKGINNAMGDMETEALLEKVNNLLQKALQGRSGEEGGLQTERLIMDMNPWGQREGIRETIGILKQAIHEKQCAVIGYISSDSVNRSRMIEPASLILKGNVWYVQAYCKLRREFRIFRVSRIQHIELTDEAFLPRQAPEIERLDWKTTWSDGCETDMALRFEPEARQRIADVFHPDEIREFPDGSFRVNVSLKADEWFYGMILSFGGKVIVESPPSVAEEVVRRAKKIIARYENQDI
ncbi:helix-turn-helix transcriptional regulator [Paenibacillus sp. DMB20]|uniref:helix-turn-helix transcriptional regulator n=1 Tax=Paenibacillus sp. DMB20 TaxID=1642570 RepID=UPI0006279B9D|nr:YafY family protein [Paenibacillus sp. DMB20]KKO54124.1 DeoR faimly transcriptional regulator [Paenibacillus sp. DMB20]